MRTTADDGVPVAIVLERSTYGRELSSIIGFPRFNNPNFVKDAKTFKKAASKVEYTFNWFYVDNRDIAYYSAGLLPVRAAGTDTDLPRWRYKKYDWQGALPDAKYVQQINPPTNYLTSQNNKLARGSAAADDRRSDGPIHRSQALSRRITKAMANGKVSPAQLAGSVEDAATEDLRAKSLLPILHKVSGKHVKTPLPYGLCGGGSFAACRSTLRKSLARAVGSAEKTQGVDQPSALTYDKSIDYIRPTVGGVVGVRPIDWQNRPTFQQVVDYRGHRAR